MKPEEKIKVIANVFSEQKSDNRPRDEVYDHMVDWHSKGWLSRPFIDDAFEAIMDGRPVEFMYEPNKYYNFLTIPKASK